MYLTIAKTNNGWFSSQTTKPSEFCKTWLLSFPDPTEDEILKDSHLISAIHLRCQPKDDHLIWMGAWAVSERKNSPVLFYRKKNYIPSRVLLCKHLATLAGLETSVPYILLPFPIQSTCDEGKACISPDHQSPWIIKSKYALEHLRPDASERNRKLDEVFQNLQRQAVTIEPTPNVVDDVLGALEKKEKPE